MRLSRPMTTLRSASRARARALRVGAILIPICIGASVATWTIVEDRALNSSTLGRLTMGVTDASTVVGPPLTQVAVSVRREKGGLADAKRAAEDLGGFAQRFYGRLSNPNRNFVYSPLSISMALSMLSVGAVGETLTQIHEVLGFSGKNAVLQQGQGALAQQLERRNERGKGPRIRKVSYDFAGNLLDGSVQVAMRPRHQQLALSTDVWFGAGTHLSPTAASTVGRFYGPSLHIADFRHRHEQCRVAINNYAADITAGMIPEILPPRTLGPQTTMVLTSVLYFRGAWLSPFDKRRTEPEVFYGADGDQHLVPTMQTTGRMGYSATPELTVIVLPYSTMELEFVVAMPTLGTFREVAEAFDRASSSPFSRAGIQHRLVELHLPKFQMSSPPATPLVAALKNAGMTDAFSPERADFSRWYSQAEARPFLAHAAHQAVVIVDEQGTEAAAATSVSTRQMDLPAEPVVVAVDHPFIFWIRDRPTNAILFLGHVVTLGD